MRFIIDGSGIVSQLTVRALLRDIHKPYVNPVFVTPLVPVGQLKHNYSESSMRGVDLVLDLMANAGECLHSHSPFIMSELEEDTDKIFIVIGAHTRAEEVRYCLDNNIQVLDLEKGLYPVTAIEEP